MQRGRIVGVAGNYQVAFGHKSCQNLTTTIEPLSSTGQVHQAVGHRLGIPKRTGF